MFSVIKTCISTLILSFLLVNLALGSSSSHPDLIENNIDIPEKNGSSLQATVDARIAMYNKQYPEVFFMQLAGGNELGESLEILQIFLGHEPTNLDYEHPPELREDLLYVNLETLIMMLEYNASSAALFRVGVNSAAERDYMCVITLTPEAVASDDVMATQDLMLNVSEQEFKQVDPATYLNHDDYLRFIIDHEAFHCLDSLYNGPRPMSKHELWGEYMAYHHHQGSDMFALAKYIRDHGGRTDFVKRIGFLRALSILYSDPNHYSFPIIQKLLSIDRKTIMNASEQQLFQLSSDMRDEVTHGYETYLSFVASAREVMTRLRGKSEIHPDVGSIVYKDKVMRELLDIVRYSYRKIFANELVPVEITH